MKKKKIKISWTSIVVILTIILGIYYCTNYTNNEISGNTVIIGKETKSIRGNLVKYFHLKTKDRGELTIRFGVPVNDETYSRYEIGDTVNFSITKYHQPDSM